MKKILLLLLLSFGFMGLANAEYNYTCENSEDSFFYNQSNLEDIKEQELKEAG